MPSKETAPGIRSPDLGLHSLAVTMGNSPPSPGLSHLTYKMGTPLAALLEVLRAKCGPDGGLAKRSLGWVLAVILPALSPASSLGLCGPEGCHPRSLGQEVDKEALRLWSLCPHTAEAHSHSPLR